jgi:penicillin-binding protein 1C
MNRPDIPNGFESSVNLPVVAFKTGTSYGRRDAWAIGYSPSHTVGVWMGNNDNTGNPEIVGGRVAAPLLFDILNTVTSDRRRTILPAPPDIGIRQVCAESGNDPGLRCTHQVEDFYSILRTQRTTCDACRETMVSPDGKVSYCAACVGDHPHTLATTVQYPPELVNFWKRIKAPAPGLPPHFAGCMNVAPGDGPTIVSPSDDMTYYVASAQQELSLQAAPSADVSTVSWYIDERFLGRVPAGAPWLVKIANGEHVASCVDDHGRATTTRFTVKTTG